MNMSRLEKICFNVCTVSILVGSVLSLPMIWGGVSDDGWLWKSWLTAVVFFTASGLILSISRAITGRPEKRDAGADHDSRVVSGSSAPTDAAS